MDIALWDDEFSNKLGELRTKVDSLSRYQAGSVAKGQAVQVCEKMLSNIENETKKLFKMELRQIEDAKTKQSFQQKYDGYNTELEKLKTELKWAMKDALIGEKKQEEQGVTRNELLKQTNQLQDQTEESLGGFRLGLYLLAWNCNIYGMQRGRRIWRKRLCRWARKGWRRCKNRRSRSTISRSPCKT